MKDSFRKPQCSVPARSSAPLRIVGIMGLFIIATQPTAWGATYHLRADGSAANKSVATGCSSVETAMNIATHGWQEFSPGDKIVLCSEGGVFRARLGVHSNGSAGAPITYEGRGTAIISASDLVHGWTHAGHNVFVAAVSVEPQQVFVNGHFGNRKADQGEVESNLDWHWESNKLYLHSSAGNPDLAYGNPGVEAGARSACLDLGGHEHVVISGISVRHSNINGLGAWNSGSNVTIRNNIAEWNWHDGIGFPGNSPFNHITIEDNETRFNGTGGIGFGPGQDSIIRRNRVHGNGKFQSAESQFEYQHRWTYGIKLWEAPGLNLQEGIEIRENDCFDNGRGHPGDFQGRGTGIWIDMIPGNPANPIIIRHNTVHGNKGNGIFIEISSNTVTFGNVLHNNATNIAGNNQVFAPANIVVDAREHWRTENNLVYNNTIFGGRQGIKVVTYEQLPGCTLSKNIIRNNIVGGASERSLYCNTGGDNDGVYGTGNVYENNNFGAESDSFISWNGIDYDTYAAWEIAYGKPSNSIEGDPRLAGNSRDRLYLTAISPCRDTGATLGAAYEDALLEATNWPDSVVTANQNSLGDGWEVGAYAIQITHRAGGRRIQP